MIPLFHRGDPCESAGPDSFAGLFFHKGRPAMEKTSVRSDRILPLRPSLRTGFHRSGFPGIKGSEPRFPKYVVLEVP